MANTLYKNLIIPGVKTYYQISKGKKRMATYVNEKEAPRTLII